MEHDSTGYLRFVDDENGEPHKVIVDVDTGIVQVARALLPRTLRLNTTRYAPHITVVDRNEPVIDRSTWGRGAGWIVTFGYDSHVYNDDTYYWLRATCPALNAVRRSLGLSDWSTGARAPDGFDSFHITIGNTKRG